jgi:hypothetical protein
LRRCNREIGFQIKRRSAKLHCVEHMGGRPGG